MWDLSFVYTTTAPRNNIINAQTSVMVSTRSHGNVANKN